MEDRPGTTGWPWGRKLTCVQTHPLPARLPMTAENTVKATTGTPVSNPTWTLLGSLPRETTLKGLGLLSFFPDRVSLCMWPPVQTTAYLGLCFSGTGIKAVRHHCLARNMFLNRTNNYRGILKTMLLVFKFKNLRPRAYSSTLLPQKDSFILQRCLKNLAYPSRTVILSDLLLRGMYFKI